MSIKRCISPAEFGVCRTPPRTTLSISRTMRSCPGVVVLPRGVDRRDTRRYGFETRKLIIIPAGPTVFCRAGANVAQTVEIERWRCCPLIARKAHLEPDESPDLQLHVRVEWPLQIRSVRSPSHEVLETSIFSTPSKEHDMPVFQTEVDADSVFVPFLTEITSDPVMGPKFAAANTSFKICFTDPAAAVFVDTTKSPIVVLSGEAALAADADVELAMSADDGHKFWLGDLNLMGALARRKIKPKGEVTKLLGLMPTLQQAYPVYGRYAADNGLRSS